MIDLPEFLWETTFLSGAKRLCLICANCTASSVLRTNTKEIVPLCEDCSKKWDFYRYLILKKFKFWDFLKKMLYFKYKNLFKAPSFYSIFKDLNELRKWAKSVRKWIK